MDQTNLNDLERIHRCLEASGIKYLTDPETETEVHVTNVLRDVIALEKGEPLLLAGNRTMVLDDCEECGKENEGFEWELHDRKLCTDCDDEYGTGRVPQEWEIDRDD